MFRSTIAAIALSGLALSYDCSKDSYYDGIDLTIPTDEAGWISLADALRARIVSTAVLVPYTASTYPDIWDAIYVLDASPYDSSQVNLTYSNYSMPDEMQALSNGWNREHVWAKSYGIEESGPDYSDVFNLRACKETVNSARANKYFSDCTSSDCVSPAVVDANPDTATNKDIWQPSAIEYGDLARSNFYMALRYNGSETNTMNLQLSECVCASKGIFGNITSLLNWSRKDPISEEEERRNDLSCSDFQHNRNPFVDFDWMVGMFDYDYFIAPCEKCT